jgi:hypothetical protein
MPPLIEEADSNLTFSLQRPKNKKWASLKCLKSFSLSLLFCNMRILTEKHQ